MHIIDQVDEPQKLYTRLKRSTVRSHIGIDTNLYSTFDFFFADDKKVLLAICWTDWNNHHNHLFVHQYLFFVKNSSTFLSATQYSHLQSFDILGILIAAPIETLMLNDEEIVEELVESKFNI